MTSRNVHQWLSNIIKHMNPDFICSPFNLVRIFVLFKTKSSLWPSKLILSRTSFLIFAYVVKISVSWFIHSTSQKFNVNWIMSLFLTATQKRKRCKIKSKCNCLNIVFWLKVFRRNSNNLCSYCFAFSQLHVIIKKRYNFYILKAKNTI